jgi:hypothetical protein
MQDIKHQYIDEQERAAAEKEGERIASMAIDAPDINMRREDHQMVLQLDPLRSAMQTKELLKFSLRNALVAPEKDRKSWIDTAAWSLVLLRSIRKQTGLDTRVKVNPSRREARLIWKAASSLARNRWLEVTDVEAKATKAYLAIREHYAQVLGSVPGVGVDQKQILDRHSESKERMR